MFSALKREGAGLRAAESILVCAPLNEGSDSGSVRATSADSFVSSPAELAELLKALCQARAAKASGGAEGAEGAGGGAGV